MKNEFELQKLTILGNKKEYLRKCLADAELRICKLAELNTYLKKQMKDHNGNVEINMEELVELQGCCADKVVYKEKMYEKKERKREEELVRMKEIAEEYKMKIERLLERGQMKEGYEDNYTKRQREVENNNSFSKRVKDNMKGNVNNSVRSSKIETVSSSKGTSPLSISLYIDSPLQGNRQKSNSFFQVR